MKAPILLPKFASAFRIPQDISTGQQDRCEVVEHKLEAANYHRIFQISEPINMLRRSFRFLLWLLIPIVLKPSFNN